MNIFRQILSLCIVLLFSVLCGTAFASTPEGSAYEQERAQLIGAFVGYLTSSGKAENVSSGASIARSGLDNNYLTHADIENFKRDYAECAFRDFDCRDAVEAKYAAISAKNREDMRSCSTVDCWRWHAERIKAAQPAVMDVYNLAYGEYAKRVPWGIWANEFITGEQNDSGRAIWIEEKTPEILALYSEANCGGVADFSCVQSLAHSQTMETLRGMAELGIDFIPGVGDVKGFVDCGNEIGWAVCGGAVVGLVPILGDGVRIMMRRGDEVIEVVADSSGALKVDGVPSSNTDGFVTPGGGATNSSDDVLLLENKYPNSNAPEHPDYPITAGPAPEGQRGWMAVEEGQINPATGQVDRPGAFLSDDPITSVGQVRNDLAVRDDWKSNPTHVQEYEIAPGTQVQSSTVGPQTNPDGTYLPGGGNQTQVLPQSGQYPSDVLVPVGPAVPIE